MVGSVLYLEGGGGKELDIRCRQGFRELLGSCGFEGRMPKLIPCGGRGDTLNRFTSFHGTGANLKFAAMLIDSEMPLEKVESTWEHLNRHDRWSRPGGVTDEQVLFMATCMETWIAADRRALKSHFGHRLEESKLPPLEKMESRSRQDVQDRLIRATKKCGRPYAKGGQSYVVLGKLKPAELEKHLPSFKRAIRILKEKLLDF